jgi:hypothetical protein
MKYTLYLFLLISISCGTNESESNLNQSGKGKNYFKCSNGTNCKLEKNEIAKDPGIHARWTIKYSLACDAGNTFNSTMSFDLSDSKSIPLKYGVSSETIVVEGSGPLEVNDHNPKMTKSEFFNNNCDLTFSYSATPSKHQIDKVWAPLVDEYIKILEHNAAIYSLSSDVENWHVTYIKNPSKTKATLEQVIEALKLSNSELDKTKAKSLQSILNERPADIYLPFSSAKERLETYLKKSATLKSQLKKWGEALDKEFTDAMKLAKDSL